MPATMPPALQFMLAARRCERQGLQGLALTCELVARISRLVHALQKERGYSNIYLGGQAAHYLERLDAHSAEARRLERDVRDGFDRLQPATTEDAEQARLFNRIAYVLHGLDELPGLRRRVREHQLGPLPATAAFTRLVGGLLAVVFEAADAAADPAIARALVAMFNFMQGKELAGQERATGVAGFSAGFFNDELLDRLQHLEEGQQRCFEVFAGYTDAHNLAAWEAIRASDTARQVERLKGIARHASANAPLEPTLCEVWFELNTQRIDAMKAVEDRLAEDLLERCRRSIREAGADLENHRTLLKRFAERNTPHQALLFSVQGSTLDSAPQGGVGNQLSRSILDLLQEQTQRLQSVSDELKEARQTLDERKVVERAKKLLMARHGLLEDMAYHQLRQSAMDRGLRLVEVAQALIDQASGPDRRGKPSRST